MFWGRAPTPIDPGFVAAASLWLNASETVMLELVWEAYDVLTAARPYFDLTDLERSITERLEAAIQDQMSGDEPFIVQHGPHERETKLPPPAQPPQYDIAFVFRADPRIMWPLEAKVLEKPGRLSAYISDVTEQYLTCRYAPFSPSGVMLAYLLSGTPDDLFEGISKRLGSALEGSTGLPTRPARISDHVRTVPTNKPYPPSFRCHHLAMIFSGVTRASIAGASERQADKEGSDDRM